MGGLLATLTTGVGVLSPVVAAAIGIAAFVRGGRSTTSQRLDRLEARYMVLEDYAHVLRSAVEQAGAQVPPWPPELTKGS